MDKLTEKEAVEAAKVAPIKRQPYQQLDDRPIRLGDEVIVFDKDDSPIKGVVRSVKKGVLGIEVVSYVQLLVLQLLWYRNLLAIYF